MEPSPSTGTAGRGGRLAAIGGWTYRALLVVCIIVATVAVAVLALEERRQTQCAQASANAEAWIAVNVVARDFDQEVSLEQNRAAVTAIDKHLHDCLPGGR
jgi:hypothetical protein